MRSAVLSHEHFEEICAAAAIGQASPEELAELERHAADCVSCRADYADCLDMAAKQFAVSGCPPELSPEESESCLNSDRFTQRFFERAKKEGIVFSKNAAHAPQPVSPDVLLFRKHASWRIPVLAAAASLAIFALSISHWKKTNAADVNRAAVAVRDKGSAAADSSGFDLEIAKLQADNAEVKSQMQQLSSELRRSEARLSKVNVDLKASAQDRLNLVSERDKLSDQLQGLQKKLSDSEALLAVAQRHASESQARVDDLQASLIADRTHIQDLTEQLAERSAAADKERQLLAVGHDVSDLMGARNLHIVDVIDTDPHGKNRPAFGRIFFTEGKSLIFYAYDLNESKIQKASYQYRVWSKKEGQDARVQSLGIFYSDDKAQRRWVFKCNDPKTLNEIDSVFVTLEPVNGQSPQPKGPNLMYAYLRGQANHP